MAKTTRPTRMEHLGQTVAAEASGKLPPQNTEAEASLLGSLLIEKDAIIKVADIVTTEDFYIDRHGLIYAAMLDLYEQRQPLDLLTLSNKLKEQGELERLGGSSYLTELTNAVPTAAHVAHYAEIVSHKANRLSSKSPKRTSSRTSSISTRFWLSHLSD